MVSHCRKENRGWREVRRPRRSRRGRSSRDWSGGRYWGQDVECRWSTNQIWYAQTLKHQGALCPVSRALEPGTTTPSNA
jgi:hypothetical protein